MRLPYLKIPVSTWYDIIEEGTIADAILDRLVNTSHRINLKGESLRKGVLKDEKLFFYTIVESFRLAQFDRNGWHGQTDIPICTKPKVKCLVIRD